MEARRRRRHPAGRASTWRRRRSPRQAPTRSSSTRTAPIPDPSTSRSPPREEGLIMSSLFRRSLNSVVFIFLVAALLAGRAFGAVVPGQSATQLPDGRWLLLGGDGASASALAITGAQG